MSKKQSNAITVALVILSCGLTYIFNEFMHHRISASTNETLAAIEASSMKSSDLIDPVNGYQFIKPIIKPDPKNESPSFYHLKSKLITYIESQKKAHKLISASVYLRYFGHGTWMNLNPTETYSPGSMFKVVNLLVYLKLSESDPTLLEKKLIYNIPANSVRTQSFNSKQIEEGKIYSINELLRYMIVNSDNNATTLLMSNINTKEYLRMLDEMKIPYPKNNNDALMLTAAQYSSIFKLLYNSSYLSNKNSEFALRLLNQSDFKIGLVSGLPDYIKVVHKFGESGTTEEPELHESGLVYMDYAPYLITIMTKGYNVNDLPPVLSAISKMVYDDISKIQE